MLNFVATTFVLALPFSALKMPGLLGNFDANLALYPFLPLALLLALQGRLAPPALARGPEGGFVRVFLLVTALAALLTVLNGWWFAGRADLYATYGAEPLRKALVTAVVPVFIAALVLTCLAVAQFLPAARFQRLMLAAFWGTAGYTLLQAVSPVLPLHGWLWPLLEGARDLGGRSYFETFGRLSGPTQEPAELAKLACCLFLPWLAYPACGPPRPAATLAALGLAVASQSITGAALAACGGLLLLGGGARTGGRLRRALIGGVCAALLALVLASDALPLLQRIAGLGEDPSAAIRLGYNLAALDIVRENAWLGVGWSNELFLFPQKVAHLAHLPEVQRDLASGDALTARSLLLRLAMYLGLPLFALLVFAAGRAFLRPGAGSVPADRARARLALLLFALGGSIDGGMLTSFYLWAAPAFPLAYLLPRPAPAGAGWPARRVAA